MSEATSPPSGPDFAQGIALDAIADGAMVSGHVGGDAVLLVRRGDELFAIGATCTHYGGPLADGLVVGDTIRCPWHHACFSLRTGEALRAPALNDVACWQVDQRDGRVYVREARATARRPELAGPALPASIVIIGAGAAGNAAAEALRREGYRGPVTLVGADPALPYDRPNLSKDYLAGAAPAEWIPLRSSEFYAEQRIDVRRDSRVVRIDPAQKSLALADGSSLAWGALLIATGADPIRLPVPGGDLPHVGVLRTLADCDALIARTGQARRCVVIGASFIGLEVAASLRARGLDVHVVAPEARPMERILGPAIGDMVKALHEAHGVVFHLGATVTEVFADRVQLSNGATLDADLVVVGIGVRPNLALAQDAGLAVERGVLVDAFLQTSVPGIYAAGDIARWPDARTGDSIRVEHWTVAERQGATAARNMLGRNERYTDVPFFWSQHYDTVINYVGHAERWDRVELDGDPLAHDCTATYWRDGKRLAVATIGRDLASLRAEVGFEQETPA